MWSLKRHDRLMKKMLLALVGLGTSVVMQAQRPAPPDAIYTGTFITLDSAQPRAEAIAVRRGVITAVGTRAQVEGSAGPATQRIALNGFALPGFADAHVHVR